MSNQHYDKLPEELKDAIVAFDRTITVPRQLVTVGPHVDDAIAQKISELLSGLHTTEEGMKLLEGLKKTKKFGLLPSDSGQALAELGALMELLANR